MKIFLGTALLLVSLSGLSQTSNRSGHVRFELFEVSIQGDTLSFQTVIYNRSLLGYRPLYFQFFIRDRHRVTRTAVQENELSPLIPFQIHTIPPKSSEEVVFLFKQFTIPRTKELVMVLKENNGSRDMVLHISGSKLLRMITPKQE